MAETADIVVSGSSRARISVDLVGKRYSLKPIKMYVFARLFEALQNAPENPADWTAEQSQASMTALDKWIGKAFLKNDAAEVRKRLEDNDDDLDIQEISELMTKMSEMMTGNPTM